VLEASLDEGEGVERGVEQRTSRSALMGLVVGLSGADVSAGAPSETADDIAAPEAKDPFGDDLRAQSEAAGKGNVEHTWKVEETTKAPPVHDEVSADDPSGSPPRDEKQPHGEEDIRLFELAAPAETGPAGHAEDGPRGDGPRDVQVPTAVEHPAPDIARGGRVDEDPDRPVIVGSVPYATSDELPKVGDTPLLDEPGEDEARLED
jgi:hypothetical protein